MKRVVAILMALCLVLPLYAKDEDSRNEFTITYGQATLPQFAYVMGGVLGVAFTAGHFTFENTLFLGGVGLEYVHYVNNWFGFGGMALVDYMTSDAYTVASDGTKTPNGKFNLGYASLMPVLKFAWLRRPHVGLYSKLGVGAGIALDNGDSAESNISWSGQVTPIGFDFGNESFRGFVEAGVGMQGLVSCGVRWLF